MDDTEYDPKYAHAYYLQALEFLEADDKKNACRALKRAISAGHAESSKLLREVYDTMIT